MEANKLLEVLGRCLHQLPRICQRECHHLLVPVYMVKETTLSTAIKGVCVASNRVCTLFSYHLWLVLGWSSRVHLTNQTGPDRFLPGQIQIKV